MDQIQLQVEGLGRKMDNQQLLWCRFFEKHFPRGLRIPSYRGRTQTRGKWRFRPVDSLIYNNQSFGRIKTSRCNKNVYAFLGKSRVLKGHCIAWQQKAASDGLRYLCWGFSNSARSRRKFRYCFVFCVLALWGDVCIAVMCAPGKVFSLSELLLQFCRPLRLSSLSELFSSRWYCDNEKYLTVESLESWHWRKLFY